MHAVLHTTTHALPTESFVDLCDHLDVNLTRRLVGQDDLVEMRWITFHASCAAGNSYRHAGGITDINWKNTESSPASGLDGGFSGRVSLF